MNRNRPVPDVYSAAVEKVKLEAGKKGYSVSEQALDGGDVRLQIVQTT